MKINLVTWKYPPNISGGGELAAQLLAEGLLDQGVSVSVLSFDGNKNEIINGVEIKRRSLPIEKILGMAETRNLFAYHVFNKEIAQDSIFQSYNMAFSPVLGYIKLKKKINLVTTLNNYTYLYPSNISSNQTSKLNFLEKIYFSISNSYLEPLTRISDKFVCLTNTVKDIYLGAGYPEKKLVVIPGMYDPRFILKKEKNFEGDIFVCSGRLHFDKGFDLILRAFEKYVKNNNLNARLLIIGDGPERKKLEALCGRLGISANVSFIGWVSIQDSVKIYETATISIVASRWAEPFGRIVLDAMAQKVPLIVSNHGGPSDIIREKKTGLFFENENFEDLYRGLVQLRDPALRSKIASAAFHDLKKFSPKKVIKEYIGVYEEIISGKK